MKLAVSIIIALSLWIGMSVASRAQASTTCTAVPSVRAHFFTPDKDNVQRVLTLGIRPISGEMMSTFDNKAGLYRYDPSNGEMLPYITDENFAGGFFAWSPDGREVAALVAENGKIGIWDVESGEQRITFNEQTPEPTLPPSVPPDEARGASGWFYLNAAWSPDGSYLAAVGTEPLRVWEVESQQLVFAPGVARALLGLNYRQQFTQLLGWSPEGNFLALAERNIVRVWDTTHWQEIQTLITPLDRIYTLSWSATDYLAVGGSGSVSNLMVWNTQTWEQVRAFDGAFRDFREQPDIFSATWSPDNCWLAVGTNRSHIYILNPANGSIVRRLGDDLINQLTVYQFSFLSANNLVWSLDNTQIFATIDGIISG